MSRPAQMPKTQTSDKVTNGVPTNPCAHRLADLAGEVQEILQVLLEAMLIFSVSCAIWRRTAPESARVRRARRLGPKASDTSAARMLAMFYPCLCHPCACHVVPCVFCHVLMFYECPVHVCALCLFLAAKRSRPSKILRGAGPTALTTWSRRSPTCESRQVASPAHLATSCESGERCPAMAPRPRGRRKKRWARRPREDAQADPARRPCWVPANEEHPYEETLCQEHRRPLHGSIDPVSQGPLRPVSCAPRRRRGGVRHIPPERGEVLQRLPDEFRPRCSPPHPRAQRQTFARKLS